MTLKALERGWLMQRAALTADELVILEHTLEALFEDMKEFGLRPKQDDRAAILEAAVIRFMIESRIEG